MAAAMDTYSHQYLATAFLNQNAIQRILQSKHEQVLDGEEMNTEDFDFSDINDGTLRIYNIEKTVSIGNTLKGKMMIISDPKRVIAGYSGELPKTGQTTSQIVMGFNAVAGINAGGFTNDEDRTDGWNHLGTGGKPDGFIIHNANIIYNAFNVPDHDPVECVALTASGKMIVGTYNIQQLFEMDVREAISFYYPLIINGIRQYVPDDGPAPRTAIGQRENGEIIMIVIDGRRIIGSMGATRAQIRDLLYENGAVTAINLDGGSSTTMVYHNKVINNPSDAMGERSIPSAFLVMPEEAVREAQPIE